MDLNQLACFVAVAEELHFGRAAERLCMTQPPLSRHIQLLEHSLGVCLLERTSRSVRLTAAGRVFLTDARRLLAQAKQAETTARRTNAGEIGRVTIGFTTVMGFDLIPKLISAAQKELPGIDIVLNEMVTVNQLEALESNQIDLGFLWPLTSKAHLKHLTMFREPLLVALPIDHRLATHDCIEIEALDEQPVVMYSSAQGRYMFSLVNGMFVSAGITPRFVQHVDQVLTTVGLVSTGIGIAIVPAVVSKFRTENVVFRPLGGSKVMAEGRMVWREDHQNPAVDTFLKFAAEYASKSKGGAKTK